MDVSDEADENQLYASIFDENLNIDNRRKPLQLPPITHHFRKSPRFDDLQKGSDKREFKKKKTKLTLDDDMAAVINEQYPIPREPLETIIKEKKKQPKRKRDKILKKIRKNKCRS